jgi:brefeldin A-inhibited guanine nucleotide-exchange protein
VQLVTESSEQDDTLKSVALETLVAVTDSMVAWEREARAHEASGGEGGEADADAESAVGGGADGGGADRGGASGGAAASSSASSAIVVAGPSAKLDFEASFHRKAELQEGVIKFNMKPKKGMDYLCKVCGLDRAPAAVAAFLLATDGLDKRAVGDFLGEGDDFNKAVLYAYVDSLDFSNSTFDAALRKFLSYFWLPGEAQKIDRMMEKFAERCVDMVIHIVSRRGRRMTAGTLPIGTARRTMAYSPTPTRHTCSPSR